MESLYAQIMKNNKMKFYLSNKKITKITQMKLYWFIEKILYLKKEKEKIGCKK